ELATAAQTAAQIAGTTQERQALVRRAVEAMGRAVELVPASPAHHANLARLLSQGAVSGMVSPERVEAAYDVALARDPNNPTVLVDAATTAVGLRRFDMLERYLARAAEAGLEARCAHFQAVRGSRALAGQRWEEAAGFFEEAIRGDWQGDELGYW